MCRFTEKNDDAAWRDISPLPDREYNTYCSFQLAKLQNEVVENVEGCEAKLDCGQCAERKPARLSKLSAVYLQSSDTIGLRPERSGKCTFGAGNKDF
jgi:hypothetical protein